MTSNKVKQPVVTVLMPVFNGEKYLRKAIESILKQTYSYFEFLIIDDGSSDSSVNIINSYSDKRIKLIRNEQNIKLIATLNRGLELARGKYIARMDCDDICLPERLEKQVVFMDANPHVCICGTWVKTIRKGEGSVWQHPTEPEVIRCKLLFECVLAHPTVMMRRQFLEKHNLKYEPGYLHAEDYKLWHRASQLADIANVGEVLMFYRVTEQSVSRLHGKIQAETISRLDGEIISSRLGFSPTRAELALHNRLRIYDIESSRTYIENVERWLLKLLKANEALKLYPKNVFKEILAERWFQVCNKTTSLGLWLWRRFSHSPLSQDIQLTLPMTLNFGARCVIRWRS